jgi:transposase
MGQGRFVLVYKRLQRGRFKLAHMDPSTMAVEINATQLASCSTASTSAASAAPVTNSSVSDRPGGRPMDKPAPT